jgi:predicted Holliday junction resolvase-like endonuclease
MEVQIIIFSILIVVFSIGSFFLGKLFYRKKSDLEILNLIKRNRKEAVEKSRHILKGQFNEQLSPFRKDFKFRASECRFLGAPIDFVCFEGLDNKQVEKVIFIEVKSGKSQLNQTEKSIKKAIQNKKIEFYEYRIN